MLADELKSLLAGASPETLRLVRAGRERDITILQEYLDAGISRVPQVDALYQMQTEILQMGPGTVTDRPKTYMLSPQGDVIKCLRCGFTSYHPKDVSEKYCGKCHQFHEP